MESELNLSPPQNKSSRPLADRMRPQNFADILGQEHLLNDGALFANALNTNTLPSMIFWGPPGSGKTTMARLVANNSDAIFVELSAVLHATADLRKVFERAEIDNKAGKKTLLLVDEIHRFNRAQQDLFLPYLENGTIILIGATTENPSFELNSALLSRCKTLIVNRLDNSALHSIMRNAENFMQQKLPLNDDAKNTLCNLADGDGRYLLNMCEELFSLTIIEPLDTQQLLKIIQKRRPIYDKSNDMHYNLISALHKSLRGSDVDAALYWMARMLDGGDDPLYILRRLIRFAVEDIGLADPNALQHAIAAKEAYQLLGSPEGELAIANSVIYLATAPKSNAAYVAFKSSRNDAKASGSVSPPKHILNAHTKLMQDIGNGKGYLYDHDGKDAFSGQNYFPESMERENYYRPVERGFERDIIKRLEYWQKLREQKSDI